MMDNAVVLCYILELLEPASAGLKGQVFEGQCLLADDSLMDHIASHLLFMALAYTHHTFV